MEGREECGSYKILRVLRYPDCLRREERTDLVSGDAGRLSPERAHHMLLTTGCSSHVDIPPA